MPCRGFGHWVVNVLVVAVAFTVGPTAMAQDYDSDDDVDLADFVVVQACFNGPNRAPVVGACADADADGDNDVDLWDFAAFQTCFNGPNRPPACQSPFIVNGCLHIHGTAAGESPALRLQPGAPTILQIDVGNDGSVDFSSDRGQFNCIVVDGGGGDDVVWIDETNGVFTDTEMTTISGRGGNDALFGGSGGERFNAGPGNDSAYMGPGNDRFIWNPGDGTDFIEGSDGIDTVEVNGEDSAEDFTVTANGPRVRFDRINPAVVFLDIGTTESLVLNANGGNDTLACTGNLAALIQITADGGPGDDTLLGSNGADVLIGGDDNDFIDGNQGSDVALLGAGDDVFQWDPGDGNDTVEGQAGDDRLIFNGSNIGEIPDLSANGARLRFTRNVGNVVLDVDGVEQVDVHALGGADTATVNGLAGTAVMQVNIDLTGILGSGTGDAQADAITVNGTAAPDTIGITANGGALDVTGLAASVQITHSEAANDSLIINGLGGVDTITQGPGVMALVMLTINQ
jgi:hypothetical protein